MKFFIMLSILLLASCSTAPPQVTTSEISEIEQIIALASNENIQGSFTIPIKAVGKQRGVTFLNSETNYKDKKNISIVLSPKISESFEGTYDLNAITYWVGKTVKVSGTAERAKIWYYQQGKKTERYYFQTHIRVTSLDQLQVLN